MPTIHSAPNDSAEADASGDRRSASRVRSSLFEYLHACPLCASSDLTQYCRVPSLFNDGEFIVYERCRGCGVVLRNPRMPPDRRLSIYRDKILPPEQKQLIERNQVHYAYILQLIDGLYPEGADRRLLDFGCGAGGFLLAARDAGFQVMGLELNGDLAEHVETTYDIPVYQGLIDDQDLDQEPFDIILSSQVFEHLLDPRATLEAIKRRLRPPGFVLIEVPNQRAWSELLRRGSTMDDSHLFYFSAKALRRLFEEVGFEVLKVQEGARLYRLWPGLTRLPQPWVEAAGSVLAGLRVRTGLSMLARLRD